MMQQKKQSGFTLVELVVAVAIVGILTAVAIPSYQNNITKSKRSSAKADLASLSSFMERLYTQAGCYNGGPDNLCGTADDAAPVLSPNQTKNGTTVLYNLSLSEISASTYTIAATPAFPDEECGTYYLKHTGEKTTSTNHEKCW